MPTPPSSGPAQADDLPPLRIGVSACLLGHKVRYDGQHKRDNFVAATLDQHVEFVPVCPEVEVGMPIPRPTLRLVRDSNKKVTDAPKLISEHGVDWTARMNRFAGRRVRALQKQQLSGYVLKSKSPSCGLERVRLYPPAEVGHQMPDKKGVGLFAAVLRTLWPNLPVEEEGRLNDPRFRENFIERVFAFHRLQALWRGRWTLGKLVAFHTAHKLALLAHEPAAYKELGRLVAAAKSVPRAELKARYEERFMAGMKKIATPGRNSNVLMHMYGYLRKELDERSKHELLGYIEDYRKGLLPLVVPITLLRHHVRHFGVEYLLGQTYLDPHPKELMLRNRV